MHHKEQYGKPNTRVKNILMLHNNTIINKTTEMCPTKASIVCGTLWRGIEILELCKTQIQ